MSGWQQGNQQPNGYQAARREQDEISRLNFINRRRSDQIHGLYWVLSKLVGGEFKEANGSFVPFLRACLGPRPNLPPSTGRRDRSTQLANGASLNCNKCFNNCSPRGPRLVTVMSCGHLYCLLCVGIHMQSQGPTCPGCGASTTKVRVIRTASPSAGQSATRPGPSQTNGSLRAIPVWQPPHPGPTGQRQGRPTRGQAAAPAAERQPGGLGRG